MEVRGARVLILGGSGLVGLAVGRELIPHGPAGIVVAGLTRAEAEEGADALREQAGAGDVEIGADWGDVFLPIDVKDRRRSELLADGPVRGRLVDDLYGPLSDEVVEGSTLGVFLARHRPHLVIDCINTATVLAYQDAYRSARDLRAAASQGGADASTVERHLATLYLPQLIRHVQITLEAMKRRGTKMYLKIGTAGTGGMGLNVPFTHSEERPSRMLLAKASLAGAHSLLLFLMARTPGGPAVKEIKPTAAISWKRIGSGEVVRDGQPVPRIDATGPIPVGEALSGSDGGWRDTGEPLRGVFLDAGENGLFSLAEFETLTALGLMEFITPEEIARDAVLEIRGHASGHDIVGALDAATSGPTYRAGVLRQSAISHMEALEEQEGTSSVAYEMLGPPRLSKLLFEATILGRLSGGDIRVAAEQDAAELARESDRLLREDDDLRVRILSIGLPILLPDGARMLRGREIKVRPATREPEEHGRLADNGWVDLRPGNWERWRVRASTIVQEAAARPGPAAGSRWDVEPWQERYEIRPGALAAWVFRQEDQGERIKR